MQHTDKSLPKKWLFEGIFGTVYCRVAEASGGFAPGPTGGLIAAPTQPAAPGNEIRSLDIVLSAGYHCHPCPHDKFGPPL